MELPADSRPRPDRLHRRGRVRALDAGINFLEELVEGADRVLVLARGRLIGELGHADASVERILRLVFEGEEQ
jgi:hypothetical protein